MKLFFIASVVLALAETIWCQDDIIMNNLNVQTNVELPKKNEDIEKAIKENCLKANGEQAFIDLQEGKEKFKSCLIRIVDIERVQEDIELLQGDLLQILSSQQLYNTSTLYCRHAPELLDCLDLFTDKWEKCLLEDDKDNFLLVTNLTETLVDFVCEEEAERIQTFISEGGIQCLLDRREHLQECFNKSIKNMWLSDVSIDDIHLLSEDTKCKKFENFQNCIVKEFDTCKENSSFEEVEELFNHVRSFLPCENVQENLLEAENVTDLYHEEKTTSKQTTNSPRIRKRNKREKLGGVKEKCAKNMRSMYVGQELISDSYQYFLHFLIEEKLFTNCTDRIKHLEAVSKEVLENFELCIPKGQYLPKLAQDVITSMLEYISKDDGKEFCDFQASFAIMCFLHSDGEDYSKCLDETKEYPTRYGEVIYDKSLLCNNANVFTTCTQNFLDNVCEDLNISTQKAFLHGLLNAFHTPCSGSLNFLNIALMLSSLALLSVQKLVQI